MVGSGSFEQYFSTTPGRGSEYLFINVLLTSVNNPDMIYGTLQDSRNVSDYVNYELS